MLCLYSLSVFASTQLKAKLALHANQAKAMKNNVVSMQTQMQVNSRDCDGRVKMLEHRLQTLVANHKKEIEYELRDREEIIATQRDKIRSIKTSLLAGVEQICTLA